MSAAFDDYDANALVAAAHAATVKNRSQAAPGIRNHDHDYRNLNHDHQLRISRAHYIRARDHPIDVCLLETLLLLDRIYDACLSV